MVLYGRNAHANTGEQYLRQSAVGQLVNIHVDRLSERRRYQGGQYSKYKHLKLAEFMLFFQRMKFGDYGKVYGSIDFAYIARALRQFCEDRAIIIDRELQRRREEEYRESLARSVSREEYERMVAAGWKPSAE